MQSKIFYNKYKNFAINNYKKRDFSKVKNKVVVVILWYTAPEIVFNFSQNLFNHTKKIFYRKIKIINWWIVLKKINMYRFIYIKKGNKMGIVWFKISMLVIKYNSVERKFIIYNSNFSNVYLQFIEVPKFAI